MTNTKIVLIGMKGCGKSTVGKLLAEKLNIQFIELDSEIEAVHQKQKEEQLNFRDIFKKYGQKYFRRIETTTLKKLTRTLKNINYIFASGGGTPMEPENQKILLKLGKIIYLKLNRHELYNRVISNGVPAFFSDPDDPKKSLDEVFKFRNPIYEKLADDVLECENKIPEQIVKMIQSQL